MADGETQKDTEQTEGEAQRATEADTITPTAEEGVPELPDAAVEITRQASVSWVFSVAGHPDPSYNGEYQRCGTWNDRPAYRLVPGGTEDTAETARCLYYWRAEFPESDEEAEQEPAAELDPELEPKGDAESEPVASADVEPIDFGAGWTFGVLESLGPPPAPSALARTNSVAQPPSLGCGDGGRSIEPFVSKMFPPEGVVSFASVAGQVWDVTIGRAPPAASTATVE